MKKIISFILVLCFIFSTTVISAFAMDSVNLNVPNAAVDHKINKLFDYYYSSLADNSTEEYSNICVENANTLFFKDFVEYDSLAKRMIDCKIETYRFEFEYVDYQSDATTAAATVNADFYFTYEDKKTESGIFNILYEFTFEKEGLVWYISSIDCDFPGYTRVKEIAEKNNFRSFEDLFESELQLLETNIDNEDYIAEAYKTGAFEPVTVDENENVMPRASSYSYNAGRAAAWAIAHANDGTSTNAYFNYISSGNCQNFVSQCVWAGYGGAVAGSGNVRQNILNDVRMVTGSSGWYGCPRGYSDYTAAWASVNTFWDFVTSNPSLGPKGTPYNDEGLYTSLSAINLTEGRVIQLRNGTRPAYNGNYQHSVIVSSTADSNITSTSYNKIYICSNTSDYCDVPLKSYMIDYFGGSNCYMRMIKFNAAYFNS